MDIISGKQFFLVVGLLPTVLVVAAEEEPLTPCNTKGKRAILSTPPAKKRRLVSPNVPERKGFGPVLLGGQLYIVERGKKLADKIVDVLSSNGASLNDDEVAPLIRCVIKDIGNGKEEVLVSSDGRSTLGVIDNFLGCNVFQEEKEWEKLSSEDKAHRLKALLEKMEGSIHKEHGVST